VFEVNYGELDQTVALVNLGARCAGINICSDGKSIFAGDVSLGGSTLTESIAEKLQVNFKEAENLKLAASDKIVQELVAEFVERTASELARQIGYFWSASGQDGGIDKIVITGGGARLDGLTEALEQESSTEASVLQTARSLTIAPHLDRSRFEKDQSLFAIATGLALRSCGDKLEIDDL
jgi:type IV pilus assembly protein PilM